MEFIELYLDIAVTAMLLQYIVYDIMKWTVDKTKTFNWVFALLMVVSLITACIYYFKFM